MKTFGILTISFLLILFSCKKDSFITSAEARITISANTLKYDTVFVTAGSTYQFFKIINENNQKLRVSSVKLMGANSNYSINVDGIVGPQVNNIDIEANDSLYVFVQVNVNPNANNLPFIIRDSVQVSYNGKNKLVQLEAWGQNAHFLRNKEISADEIWNNDLPYVILGSLFIYPDKSLTINKGCRIYIHADAPVVVDGSLIINGQKDTADRVYFRGDRLDEPYKDFPASWPGIFFRGSSKNNVLNYSVIKNAYQAIAAEDPSANANPKIILNECVIDNAYDAGIIALNSSIQARNCLVSNCGKNIVLAKGGNYQFTHCTVASYSNNFIQHKDPVLYLSNFIKVNNVPVPSNLTATFTNCIFWGEGGQVDNEVVSDKNSGATYNVTFNQALWKTTGVSPNFTIIQPTPINQTPQFDSINISKNYYDFRLKANMSPAIDKGTNAGVTIDLDGKPRPLGIKPDLGCFEKQ
ncbi:MAG: choice-of-anchor Q domain-containing protein [Bacteroidota bacterium]